MHLQGHRWDILELGRCWLFFPPIFLHHTLGPLYSLQQRTPRWLHGPCTENLDTNRRVGWDTNIAFRFGSRSSEPPFSSHLQCVFQLWGTFSNYVLESKWVFWVQLIWPEVDVGIWGEELWPRASHTIHCISLHGRENYIVYLRCRCWQCKCLMFPTWCNHKPRFTEEIQ